jgi:hypothetical protein
MNTEPPAPTEAPIPVAAKPVVKWYKKKRVLLPLVAAVFFFTGVTSGAKEATARCKTATDRISQFDDAATAEHVAIRAAVNKANQDGDTSAALDSIRQAGITAQGRISPLIGPLNEAVGLCRAAIK